MITNDPPRPAKFTVGDHVICSILYPRLNRVESVTWCHTNYQWKYKLLDYSSHVAEHTLTSIAE